MTIVPATMDGPHKLPRGDHWTWTCPERNCNLVTQGGRAGLNAHLKVVHGR